MPPAWHLASDAHPLRGDRGGHKLAPHRGSVRTPRCPLRCPDSKQGEASRHRWLALESCGASGGLIVLAPAVASRKPCAGYPSAWRTRCSICLLIPGRPRGPVDRKSPACNLFAGQIANASRRLWKRRVRRMHTSSRVRAGAIGQQAGGIGGGSHRPCPRASQTGADRPRPEHCRLAALTCGFAATKMSGCLRK
jgi:hypothetical protein